MRRRRVAFIQPNPAEGITGDNAPFGLLSLASYVKREVRDVECKLFLLPLGKKVPATLNSIMKWADAVAVSIFDITFIEGREVIKAAHAWRRPVILGGHTVTHQPEWTREKLRQFDNVTYVVGPGEITIRDWMDNGFPTAGEAPITGNLLPKDDILIDIDVYARPYPQEFYQAILQSRSCPYTCTFCQSMTKYQARTTANIIEEAEIAVRRYGFRRLDLIGGMVFMPTPGFFELAKMWRESRILRDVRVTGCGKFGPNMKPEIYEPWRGLIEYVFVSVEAGNNQMLAKLKKKFTVQDVRDGLEILLPFNIPLIYFSGIVGFPFETAQDVTDLKEMIEYIRERCLRHGTYPNMNVIKLIPCFGAEVAREYPVPTYDPSRPSAHRARYWYKMDAKHQQACARVLAEYPWVRRRSEDLLAASPLYQPEVWQPPVPITTVPISNPELVQLSV